MVTSGLIVTDDKATVGSKPPRAAPLTVRSRTFRLPTSITTAERLKLLQFRIDHRRDPAPGDGEMYELHERVKAEAAKALATAPRQPGESESGYTWRKQSGERTLARIEAATAAAARAEPTAPPPPAPARPPAGVVAAMRPRAAGLRRPSTRT